MTTARTFEETREAAMGTVALVPTMGFLHEGHLRLIQHAADRYESVVMSLFVNPTQFGDASDLDTYPRNEERDVRLALEAGADIVFAPCVEEMYPEGPDATVSVDAVTEGMEGDHRPGHFDGVATVVTKLLVGIRPDAALFGRKDAQQLAVVRSLVRSLRVPAGIEAVPTVREHDGLALSSRNVRLDSEARSRAVQLSAALFAAADLIDRGERDRAPLVGLVHSLLADDSTIDVDYVELADAATAAPVESIRRDAFLAVAAHIGGVRLIDNIFIDATSGRVDRGQRLDGPSILYGEA